MSCMEEDQQQKGQPQSPAQEVSLKKLLEEVAPGRTVRVKNLGVLNTSSGGHRWYALQLPVLELHCEAESCAGVRLFEPQNEPTISLADKSKDVFLIYRCRNCTLIHKTYALAARG